MKGTTATITTKGQVTLPKKIRELLQVDTGDILHFVLNDEGKIIIEKGNPGEKREVLLNLIKELQKNTDTFVIIGSPEYKQTTFLKELFDSNEVNFWTVLVDDIKKVLSKSKNNTLVSLQPLTDKERKTLGTHYEIQVSRRFESGISQIDLITIDDAIQRTPIYIG